MNPHITLNPFDCGNYILGNFTRIPDHLSEELKTDIDNALKIHSYTNISTTLLDSQQPIIDYLISKHKFKEIAIYGNKYEGFLNRIHLLIYINPKFKIKEKP